MLPKTLYCGIRNRKWHYYVIKKFFLEKCSRTLNYVTKIYLETFIDFFLKK